MNTQLTPESPWTGLQSFGEADRHYFYGREAEVQELLDRVVALPLTILYSRSGFGKTSLVRAGLIPQLREAGYMPVLIRLEHFADSPPYENQVFQAIMTSLRDLATAALDTQTGIVPTLWELFHDPNAGFLSPSGVPLARLVLVFDQFEEIFTVGSPRSDEVAAFREVLSSLAENRIPDTVQRKINLDDTLAERLQYTLNPCRVVLSLREDFLSRIERWRRAIPSLMENRTELGPLTGPQALAAVVEPGRLRCVGGLPPIIPDEIGAAIVRIVAGVGPEVPLAEIDAVPAFLPLVCAGLNDRRLAMTPTPPLQISSAQLQGGAGETIENFYYSSFEGLPSALRVVVEDELMSNEGFRTSIPLDSILAQLVTAGLGGEEARAALDTLVTKRLLAVIDKGGLLHVELAHDILTSTVRRSRDERFQREQLASAEQARAEAARHDQDKRLAQAGRLAEAERHAQAEWRTEEQRHQLRRARLVGFGFAVLFLTATFAGGFAWLQKRDATRAEARMVIILQEQSRRLEIAATAEARERALAFWLNGQRDEAVETYRKLIAAAPAWAKPETIAGKEWPEAESRPLEEVRAETVKRHPELLPPR